MRSIRGVRGHCWISNEMVKITPSNKMLIVKKNAQENECSGNEDAEIKEWQ